MPDGNRAGISTAAPVERRVSVAEVAAFVAEANRFLDEGGASVQDRIVFFEWKADLFVRLTRDETDESVVEARAKVARLRAERAAEPAGPAEGQGSGESTGRDSGRGAA